MASTVTIQNYELGVQARSMIEASAKVGAGMVGILVHGNNHFILGGPEPSEAEAIAAARHFSVVRIGEPVSNSFERWEIRNKEFRENLKWAVVVPGDAEISSGVSQLLGEMAERGVIVRACAEGCW